VAKLLAESPLDEVNHATAKGRSENVTITLGGMWCSSCAWMVNENLRRTKGVIDSNVSFIQGQANINFDSAVTNPKTLKKRVRSLGYLATLPDEKPRDEEESFYTRLLIAGVMVLHDMIVGAGIYARELFGWVTPESQPLVDFFQVMMFVSSLPVLILLGLPILRAGFASLMRGQPNIHTLITIGTFSAFGLSVRNLIAGTGGQYFDTATMLIFLISIGRWLEMQAHKTSNQTVKKLFEQIPQKAMVVTDNGQKELKIDELKPGMRIHVRPGERFPVDGLIATGEGDVDESLLTGEPIPVNHESGDPVKAGTINLDGSFEVITTAVGDLTTAGQIGRLLHEALWNRSPLERLADKLSAWMTPVALSLAGIAFYVWSGRSGIENGLLVGLSVLLIACPCALGLATPLTLWLSLGRAAASGVIMRSTSVLERIAKVENVRFDKTGTLTILPMNVKSIFTSGIDQSSFLQIVGSIEDESEHPLGMAISDYAKIRQIEFDKPKSFKVFPGMGVKGVLRDEDGQLLVVIGNERFMTQENILISNNMKSCAESLRAEGKVVVYAGWGGQVQGLLGLGETIREDAKEVIAQLQSHGLDLGVLTGDEAAAGQRWQDVLNIPVHAGLKPEEKASFIKENTAMIGDGINDGPALAVSAIGLAMNHGTDVAQTAADVVLMRDDLRVIPWLFDLSKSTMRIVKENLGWAFVYNIIGVGLAMAGLMRPVWAALAMVTSSVFVTANAMRINKFPLIYEDDTVITNLNKAGTPGQ